MTRGLRAAFLGAVLSSSLGAVACAQQPSAGAAQQMQAIMEEKASRSPEQQKIDSHLLRAQREARGGPAEPGAPAVRSGVEVDASGATVVDIDAKVTEAVLKRISEDGGRVLSSFPQYDAIRASMPLDRLDDLARMAEVRFIRPAAKATTNQR